MCELCKLIDKIKNEESKKTPWTKEIGDVKLTGTKYAFKDGKTEIVRLLNDKFLFINSIRVTREDYDAIVCTPLKHTPKEDYDPRELDKTINEFVKKHYPHARVIENHGWASSVQNHCHKHIFYTKDTALELEIIPLERRKP